MARWRRKLSLLATLVLLVGCAGTPALPGSTDDFGDFTFPPFEGPTNRPSGAQLRVVNLYTPVTSEPGAIDVYGEVFVDSSSSPIVSVPYGTVSAFVDPTAMDEDGNGFLTFMPAGVTDDASALMSKSETFKPGQIITIFLATSGLLDGGFGASSHYFGHHPEAGGLADTPAPGKGLLTVVSTGLDAILSDVSSQSWFVSFGNGCEPGLGNAPGSGSTSAVSPGQTGATYEIEPGQHTVTIHAHPSDQAPDCSTPPIAEAQVEAKSGVTDVLFLYAPKDGDLRSIMVPLEP